MLLPKGWKLELVEGESPMMRLTNAEGSWAGFMPENGPAQALAFEFMQALWAKQLKLHETLQATLLQRANDTIQAEFAFNQPEGTTYEQFQELVLADSTEISVSDEYEGHDPDEVVEIMNSMRDALLEEYTAVAGIAIMSHIQNAPTTRVLVTVEKGLAYYNTDGNVEVHIQDKDIEPVEEVPAEFKHLV
jgi:hypothetical protein